MYIRINMITIEDLLKLRRHFHYKYCNRLKHDLSISFIMELDFKTYNDIMNTIPLPFLNSWKEKHICNMEIVVLDDVVDHIGFFMKIE